MKYQAANLNLIFTFLLIILVFSYATTENHYFLLAESNKYIEAIYTSKLIALLLRDSCSKETLIDSLKFNMCQRVFMINVSSRNCESARRKKAWEKVRSKQT